MARKASRSSNDQVLNRGAWTAKEDQLLSEYVKINGETGWTSMPRKIGLKRGGKSCRMRWLNYLRPDIKRGNISSDEEELIVRLHDLLGNRWSLIAGRLPGRTDNEIKNYWNTHLSKKWASTQTSVPKLNKRRKSAPPATDGLLKVTPVKVTAVRIPKDCNKYLDTGNSNLQTTDTAQTVKASRSCSDLLMTDHDSVAIDFTMAVELESPSVEISGQYSTEDFGIEELQKSPCKSLEMSFLCNCIEQVQNSTDAGCNGMEGLYSGTQHGDWIDELQYFQMSSPLPLEFHEEDLTQFS